MPSPPNDEDGSDVEDVRETAAEEGDSPEDGQDAGDGQDEGQADHQEEDDDGFDGGEVEERRPTRRSRENETIRELRERAQRAETLAAEAERRQLERDTHVNQAEQRRLREERMSLMEPHERTEFLLNERMEQMQQRMLHQERQMEDRTDKAEFASMCKDDKAMAAVREEVESELTKMRQSGHNISRENLAYYLIGKRTAAKAKSATTKAGKAGRDRLARQTGRPINSRGEGNSEGRSGKSARDRLEGKTF